MVRQALSGALIVQRASGCRNPTAPNAWNPERVHSRQVPSVHRAAGCSHPCSCERTAADAVDTRRSKPHLFHHHPSTPEPRTESIRCEADSSLNRLIGSQTRVAGPFNYLPLACQCAGLFALASRASSVQSPKQWRLLQQDRFSIIAQVASRLQVAPLPWRHR